MRRDAQQEKQVARDALLRELEERGPWYPEGRGDETPIPTCFFCGKSSWGQHLKDHAPDCPWLKAHQTGVFTQ